MQSNTQEWEAAKKNRAPLHYDSFVRIAASLLFCYDSISFNMAHVQKSLSVALFSSEALEAVREAAHGSDTVREELEYEPDMTIAGVDAEDLAKVARELALRKQPLPPEVELAEAKAKEEEAAEFAAPKLNDTSVEWQCKSQTEIESLLQVSAVSGLSETEATRRLELSGPNELEMEKPPTLLKLFLLQFKNTVCGLSCSFRSLTCRSARISHR